MLVLVFLLIFVLVVIIAINNNIIESERFLAEKKHRLQVVEQEEYEKALAKLSEKYGDCSINENFGNCDEHRIISRVLIFEQSSVIIIKSKEYRFSDILGYSLIDDTSSRTVTTSTGKAKTSTGSLLGRAVVGGVLTGGVGAVAGAATAKKNITGNATSQTTTEHEYTLYVNVNNLQEPTIVLEIGNKTSTAQRLAGIMNIIIDRNKNK